LGAGGKLGEIVFVLGLIVNAAGFAGKPAM